MLDLNYENFHHSTILVQENKIIEWENIPLSSDLKEKYQNIQLPTNKPMTAAQKKYDTNGDNNLGYFECYKCLKAGWDASGFGQWFCDIPALGWASCWTSASAACVYISAVY